MASIIGLSMFGACDYGASFHDCTIACTTTTGCPDGFTCGSEGRCRAVGLTETCAALGDAALTDVGSDAMACETNAECDSVVAGTCCVAPGESGHCTVGTVIAGVCQPSATFTPSNLDPVAGDLLVGTRDVVLGDATIDTDTGTISGVVLSSGEARVQVQPAGAPAIQVFRFKSLRIDGVVTVTGKRALTIVAVETIAIDGEIRFLTTDRAACGSFGGSGGDVEPTEHAGPGGGGGGFGTDGAVGGDYPSNGSGGVSGPAHGTPALIPLLPGCWGGGLPSNDYLGAGGGALHLAAGTSIAVSGTLCVSGEGGTGSYSVEALGAIVVSPAIGGGSGGAILLEAPDVIVGTSATLAANGGGGGGGAVVDYGGRSGMPGGSSCSATTGGAGNPTAPGGGGNGGYGTAPAQAGRPGDSASMLQGGGGGGGVGRIRINRGDGGIPAGATSPPPSLGELLPP